VWSRDLDLSSVWRPVFSGIIVACHDEFCDMVGKYKIMERTNVGVRVRFGLELGFGI